MTDETGDGGVEHLLSAAAHSRTGSFDIRGLQSSITDETVELTYGYPYPAALPNQRVAAAVNALFAAESDRALQYGGGELADRLPAIVARRCRDRGLQCGADEVLLTNGALNAIDVVCRAFLDPGDNVFLEGPTFSWSLAVIQTYDIEIDSFPVDAEGVDADAIADELDRRTSAGRTLPKLLYTIPNFQNPTGVTLSRSRREHLLELATEYDFLILEDDPYGRLRFEGQDIPPLRALDDTGRVVHTGTFSKTIAPGVRTGWAVADRAVVERLGAGHTGGPSTFTKGLVSAYCEAGHLEEAVTDLRKAYRERRDYMLASLRQHMPDDVGWTTPAGGFFIWVELPDTVDTEAMLDDAIANGVAYIPGNRFFPDDGGEHCLRLSFSYASFDEIDRGIASLAATVRAYTGQS